MEVSCELGSGSGLLMPVWGGGAPPSSSVLCLCAAYKLVEPGSQVRPHSRMVTSIVHLASPRSPPFIVLPGGAWHSKYCMCDLADRARPRGWEWGVA